MRRWLRHATRNAHLTRLWRPGSQILIWFDPDAFNRLPGVTNPLRDVLTVLTTAVCVARRPVGSTEPMWTPIDPPPTAGSQQHRT